MGRRVLVCGAGSIGRRHISNLLDLGAEVFVWRNRGELLSEIASEFPVQICSSLTEGISVVEAVVVATATDEHIPIATMALKAKRALFIEKPLSNNWDGVDALSKLAEGNVVEVGFQFRSHPNLIELAAVLQSSEQGKILAYRLAMGHRLDAWRPEQDYRQGYSANSERGGGALFDLIHQIDIALWLFGPASGVQAVMANLGTLNIKGDDMTNLLLTHKNGLTGHIQLDMASPVYRCEVEVMTTSAIFQWSSKEGKVYKISPEGETIIDQLPPKFGRNNLFHSHMRHFLERIGNSEISPLCSFHDGMAALNVAIRVRDANASKKMTLI
jgi:predicted dehydrogenase